MPRTCTLLRTCLALACLAMAAAAEDATWDMSAQGFHLAYGGWQDHAASGPGGIAIDAPARGGMLLARSLDLSAQAEAVPALSLTPRAGNQETVLILRLADAAGHLGSWRFDLAGLPAGARTTVAAGRPLARPDGDALDLARIRQIHLQGSYLVAGRLAMDLHRLFLVPAADAPAPRPAAAAPATAPLLVHDFTREGLPVAYVGWKDHVGLAEGATRIEARNGQGGALAIRAYDLRGHEQDALALTVRARAGNALTGLKLLLKDGAGAEATWPIDISAIASGATATVLAGAGAAVGNPPDSKGAIDLGAITQLQIIGNWSDKERTALDLLRLETVPATPGMAARRQAEADKAATAAIAALPPLRPLADIAPLPRGAQSPRIVGTCLVAPDVLAVTIEAGAVQLGRVVDYRPEPGDGIAGTAEAPVLRRGGKEIGELVGAGEHRQVVTRATSGGDPLQTEIADHPAAWTVSSADDPAYAAGTHPLAVHRKSKPIDYLGGQKTLPARHVVFLRLPRPLAEGRGYRIDAGPLNLLEPVAAFRNDTRSTRSLAVHTTQIGYRADDPFKRGYLSIWLGPSTWSGSGGAFTYPAGLRFHLLDDASGAEVFAGAVEMARKASESEAMFRDQNFNGTDVLRMDFSAFAKPGRYRLQVDGIGCGYPFSIGAGTWAEAFRIQMRGFFHQRSGIALGPPYTSFVKPRDHHPADGVPVIRSAWAAPIWGGASEHDLQKGLAEKSTGEQVANGWGGWMDAGDWNPRRVTHMRATLAQLEIADLFPAFVAGVKLSIPQDYQVPDLFNEALFEIDCFRRMQSADGGVGYGLETVGDPAIYGVSWQTRKLPVYMAAPEPGSSWYYAAVAARAGRLLQPIDPALAKVYADSALRAMQWAEAEFARQKAAQGKGSSADLEWTVRDSRNLAAIELLRLTADKRWHDVFLEDTVLKTDGAGLFAWGKAVQMDAAFAYAIADRKLTDPVLRARAVAGLEALARAGSAYADGNAFDIVSLEKGRPMFMGFYSTPWCGRLALRAYHLTGKPEYLALGLRATQFSSGANPDNLVFTTGLGANPVRHALKLDAQSTGQPVPEGLTVYGIEDHVNFPSSWSYWILGAIDSVMSPGYLKWPVTESYTDTVFFICQNEFTTDIWDESTWTWGYLAGRPIAEGR